MKLDPPVRNDVDCVFQAGKFMSGVTSSAFTLEPVDVRERRAACQHGASAEVLLKGATLKNAGSQMWHPPARNISTTAGSPPAPLSVPVSPPVGLRLRLLAVFLT